MRKISLDELLNLFKILKAEIFFVGPRPALCNQDDLMEFRVATAGSKLKHHNTVWAQINLRDEISIPKKVQLPQEYLYKNLLKSCLVNE